MIHNDFSKHDSDNARQALIDALSPHSNLARRMTRCGVVTDGHNHAFDCNTAGCPRCRAIYRRKQQKKVRSRFSSAERCDLSMFTIVFDVAGHADDLGPVLAKARKDLHNFIDARRKEGKRWNSVEMIGWWEADPFTPETIPLLGSEQQEMLASLGIVSHRTDGGPAWCFHVHGIIHHPRLDWQQVRDAFAGRWNKPFQIDISNFEDRYPNQPKEVSLDKVTAYSLKYKVGRWMSGGIDYWYGTWLAEYYDWIYSLHSSKSWRFEKKAKYVYSNNYSFNDIDRDTYSMEDILHTDINNDNDYFI